VFYALLRLNLSDQGEGSGLRIDECGIMGANPNTHMLTNDTPLGDYRFLISLVEDFPEDPDAKGWTAPIRAWNLADAWRKYRNTYPILSFTYSPVTT
jgi:hypothetical protein